MEDVAAGILWIAIAFSGTLALGRAFERERQGETLRALLIAPIDRPALYLGKLLGILILLAAVEVLIVPLVALMFQAALFDHALLMIGLFTRISAFILSGQMAFAYFIGHMFKNAAAPVFHPILNGGTAAILFCFACLYLATAGGGPISADAMMRKK